MVGLVSRDQAFIWFFFFYLKDHIRQSLNLAKSDINRPAFVS